jgi:hypothetical protein
MEIHIELFSETHCLIGFQYRKGQGTAVDKKGEKKEVLFHEFSIGLLFINFNVAFF